MDDGDIISIPTWRQVVQEIIDGKRDRHLYEKKLRVGEYVEFFSAPLNDAHGTVEEYPEPDAIRVMVIVSEVTEGPHGQWFFQWKATVPYRQPDDERTDEGEKFLILDALRQFSDRTGCFVPALPVSKVTGLPLQLVEDSFELLAEDDYVKHDHDSRDHAAELRAKGRRFLREYARRRTATDDPMMTSSAKGDGVTNPSPQAIGTASNETSQAAKAIASPPIGSADGFQLVLLIHGIRTQADWGPMVVSKLRSGWPSRSHVRRT
jgi:predicted transcriptional regulator